jgi:hypothetical protein
MVSLAERRKCRRRSICWTVLKNLSSTSNVGNRLMANALERTLKQGLGARR